jgi:hypothetical protein
MNITKNSKPKLKSWYWIAYELALKSGSNDNLPAFIELPGCNVCVWFAPANLINDTYVDDITDNKGYSLIHIEGFWKDTFNSQTFQDRALEQFKAMIEERQIDKAA